MKHRRFVTLCLSILGILIASAFFYLATAYGGNQPAVSAHVFWQCGEVDGYPVDITDGRWDTAVLVAGGVIDPSSIRVEVDGAEVDYWLVDFDTDHTSVWVNLDFAAEETNKVIEIIYSSTAQLPYVVDDNYKPAFNLDTSTNASWDYDEFGDDGGLRSGRWSFAAPGTFGATRYTAHHNTNASPWTEMGAASDTADLSSGRWSTYNPCGITNANFQNGDRYTDFEVLSIGWGASIQSSVNGTTWVLEYDIPANTVAATWEAWSQNQVLDAGAIYVGMNHIFAYGNDGVYLEVDDVTLSIASPPTILLDPITYYFPVFFKE